MPRGFDFSGLDNPDGSIDITPKTHRTLTDYDLCPIPGQYSLHKMMDVPAKFLGWLRTQHWLPLKYPGLNKYIEENWSVISAELAEETTDVNDQPEWFHEEDSKDVPF